MTPIAGWNAILHANAAEYARVALNNIAREFPSDVRQLMTAPGDFPHRPRDRNPVFYGSFDWHSCVEMHWLLVRLLRTAPQHVPEAEIRKTLDVQFAPDGLLAEARFVADPNGGPGGRPYAWGWALALAHEVAALGEQAWTANLRPLADAVTARMLGWLPKQTYPVRHGTHINSAFGLSRSLPHARDRAAAGDPALLDAIGAAARRWFRADADYPGGWEPSGSDFLSAALPGPEFASWLHAFLPGLEKCRPSALFAPVTVSDSSDGQIAYAVLLLT